MTKRSARSAARVEAVGPRILLATFTVTSTVDAGPGSLRECILAANANGGADTIAFSIGTGQQTIRPATNLPAVEGATTIDGRTQPGWAGTPLIQIDGPSDIAARESVGLNRDVENGSSNLTVRSIDDGRLYDNGAFNYDPVKHVATWTLAGPPLADRVSLDLPSGALGVRAGGGGAGGTQLDGEWDNGSDAYPSGDGAAGGDIHFRLNLLPGDATRSGNVDSLDLAYVKQRLNRTARKPGDRRNRLHALRRLERRRPHQLARHLGGETVAEPPPAGRAAAGGFDFAGRGAGFGNQGLVRRRVNPAGLIATARPPASRQARLALRQRRRSV